MPLGIIVNCAAILAGGIIGGSIGDRVPAQMKHSLTMVFGISAVSIGITSMIKVNILSAVILSLILGMIIGETLGLEKRIHSVFRKVIYRLPLADKVRNEEALDAFITIVVLFCASGTGVFGALMEGISGDSSILLSKSIMDFFTAAVFATTMGYLVSAISIPQIAIFLLLFSMARLFMSELPPELIANFTACGGIITFVVGLRICGIMKLSVINLIPALLLVMPVSQFWSRFLM